MAKRRGAAALLSWGERAGEVRERETKVAKRAAEGPLGTARGLAASHHDAYTDVLLSVSGITPEQDQAGMGTGQPTH